MGTKVSRSAGNKCSLLTGHTGHREDDQVRPSLPEDTYSSKRAPAAVDLTRLPLGESYLRLVRLEWQDMFWWWTTT